MNNRILRHIFSERRIEQLNNWIWRAAVTDERRSGQSQYSAANIDDCDAGQDDEDVDDEDDADDVDDVDDEGDEEEDC